MSHTTDLTCCCRDEHLPRLRLRHHAGNPARPLTVLEMRSSKWTVREYDAALATQATRGSQGTSLTNHPHAKDQLWASL